MFWIHEVPYLVLPDIHISDTRGNIPGFTWYPCFGYMRYHTWFYLISMLWICEVPYLVLPDIHVLDTWGTVLGFYLLSMFRYMRYHTWFYLLSMFLRYCTWFCLISTSFNMEYTIIQYIVLFMSFSDIIQTFFTWKEYTKMFKLASKWLYFSQFDLQCHATSNAIIKHLQSISQTVYDLIIPIVWKYVFILNP